ncbi:hypothetical protein B0H11DRAFT_2234118 [Mycena galericulata]|nr:hypothetical protein B0H11DRAFT_2234118 [Mycena galericulata]
MAQSHEWDATPVLLGKPPLLESPLKSRSTHINLETRQGVAKMPRAREKSPPDPRLLDPDTLGAYRVRRALKTPPGASKPDLKTRQELAVQLRSTYQKPIFPPRPPTRQTPIGTPPPLPRSYVPPTVQPRSPSDEARRLYPSHMTCPTPEAPLDHTTVTLRPLPLSMTLSDLGRIALRAGAHATDVLGLRTWVMKDRMHAEKKQARDENRESTHASPWGAGGTIHFRDAATARAFCAEPLLLEVVPPPTSASSSSSILAPRPVIRIFPPAAEASAWSAERLERLAKAARLGNLEDMKVIMSSAGASEDESDSRAPDRAPKVGALHQFAETQRVAEEELERKAMEAELDLISKLGLDPESTKEQEAHEKAQVLKKMWSHLEDVDIGPDGRIRAQLVDVRGPDGRMPVPAEEAVASREADSQTSAEYVDAELDERSLALHQDYDVEGEIEASVKVSATDAPLKEDPYLSLLMDDAEEAEGIEASGWTSLLSNEEARQVDHAEEGDGIETTHDAFLLSVVDQPPAQRMNADEAAEGIKASRDTSLWSNEDQPPAYQVDDEEVAKGDGKDASPEITLRYPFTAEGEDVIRAHIRLQEEERITAPLTSTRSRRLLQGAQPPEGPAPPEQPPQSPPLEIRGISLECTHHPSYALPVLDSLSHIGAARWLALRVPGSGVPIGAPAPAPNAQGNADAHAEEAPDPTVQLYALALRKALARERELEGTLRRAREEATAHAAAEARMAAMAQVRADFGTFGALEGVWVRGVRVRRPETERAAPEIEMEGESESAAEKEWVYELHALVAFSDVHAAVRAKKSLPLQIPAYGQAGIRYVTEPWREALEGRVPSDLERTVDAQAGEGEGEVEILDGAREGWARRLERQHQAEARARERERERERQRGAAEGTWGKERLSEIRERLQRMQRREQPAQPTLFREREGAHNRDNDQMQEWLETRSRMFSSGTPTLLDIEKRRLRLLENLLKSPSAAGPDSSSDASRPPSNSDLDASKPSSDSDSDLDSSSALDSNSGSGLDSDTPSPSSSNSDSDTYSPSVSFSPSDMNSGSGSDSDTPSPSSSDSDSDSDSDPYIPSVSFSPSDMNSGSGSDSDTPSPSSSDSGSDSDTYIPSVSFSPSLDMNSDSDSDSDSDVDTPHSAAKSFPYVTHF